MTLDTIDHLLALLKPAAFQPCFKQWIASLRTSDAGDTEDDEIIVIDGKAVWIVRGGNLPRVVRYQQRFGRYAERTGILPPFLPAAFLISIAARYRLQFPRLAAVIDRTPTRA